MTKNKSDIIYSIKTASQDQILNHLLLCNNDFIPPLDLKVDLREYASKLAEKSITFEAWQNNELLGLIAAYFNNSDSGSGYITNVSVLKNFSGQGIASQLLTNCLDHALRMGFFNVKLEVHKNNHTAIQLYEKYNFSVSGKKDDYLIMERAISR